MISETQKRDSQRARRKMRVGKSVRGDAARPRLSVFKSNKHLFVQVIDDEQGKTLVSLGTMTKECKGKHETKSKEAASFLGQEIAKKALEQNITRVVFDRGRYQYHGLLAAIAAAAREAGLQF